MESNSFFKLSPKMHGALIAALIIIGTPFSIVILGKLFLLLLYFLFGSSMHDYLLNAGGFWVIVTIIMLFVHFMLLISHIEDEERGSETAFIEDFKNSIK